MANEPDHDNIPTNGVESLNDPLILDEAEGLGEEAVLAE